MLFCVVYVFEGDIYGYVGVSVEGEGRPQPLVSGAIYFLCERVYRWRGVFVGNNEEKKEFHLLLWEVYMK